jgi:hypothetical protein
VTQALKEARLQIPVLTNRNLIRGYHVGISKHIIATSEGIKKHMVVDQAAIGRKTMPLPGEVSVATRWQSGEVSRGRSSWEQMSRGCQYHTLEDSQTNEGPNVEMF